VATVAQAPDEYDEGDNADVAGLRRFLETKAMSWYETRRKELRNRPLIRMQALGEAVPAVYAIRTYW